MWNFKQLLLSPRWIFVAKKNVLVSRFRLLRLLFRGRDISRTNRLSLSVNLNRFKGIHNQSDLKFIFICATLKCKCSRKRSAPYHDSPDRTHTAVLTPCAGLKRTISVSCAHWEWMNALHLSEGHRGFRLRAFMHICAAIDYFVLAGPFSTDGLLNGLVGPKGQEGTRGPRQTERVILFFG